MPLLPSLAANAWRKLADEARASELPRVDPSSTREGWSLLRLGNEVIAEVRNDQVPYLLASRSASLRLCAESDRAPAPRGGEVTIAENVRVHAPTDGAMWVEASGRPGLAFFHVPCSADAQKLILQAPDDKPWFLVLVPM
jgi:hypothetical protein